MKMEQHLAKSESSDSKDMLLAIGGVALIVFGAGLVMSHPAIRRYFGTSGLGGMLAGAVPDIERYMRLRSM
jgi:hypothetical protein